MEIGRSRARTIAVIVTVLLVGVAVVFVATYERNDPGDEKAIAPPSTFPPGTITPGGAETDCGEYVWPIESQLDDSVEDQFPNKHDCFTEALAAGTPAVLGEHSFSTEGDPVRTQFRVTGPDQFDLTHDSTLDNFGSQTVYTVHCTGLEITDSQVDPVVCDPPPD